MMVRTLGLLVALFVFALINHFLRVHPSHLGSAPLGKGVLLVPFLTLMGLSVGIFGPAFMAWIQVSAQWLIVVAGYVAIPSALLIWLYW